MVMSGQVLVWARLTVPGNGAVDDSGVDSSDIPVAKAQARHRSGRQVLDHDVRLLRQLKKHPSPLCVFKVQGYALDPLRALEEPNGEVVVGLPIGVYSPQADIGADTANRIARARHLHLDDLGPEPRKGHTQKRSGEEDSD